MLEISTIIIIFIERVAAGFLRLVGGGWLLIPIIIYSLFVHAIIIERAINLRIKKLIPSKFVTDQIYQALRQSEPDNAIKLCDKKPGPLTNMLKEGIIHRHYDEKRLRLVVKFAIEAEKPTITKYLHMLGMLAPVAMSTGLLGTVVGMIKSFGNLYTAPTEVAIGISQALITTVAGLIVALPTYIAHDYFTNKAGAIIAVMERLSIALVRFFTTAEHKLDKILFTDIADLQKEEPSS